MRSSRARGQRDPVERGVQLHGAEGEGVVSAQSARAAPAFIAAIPTSPDPDAKSSTARPATSAGWSSTWRARAWPPAQAKAQKGGGRPISPSSSSVRRQSVVASWARCSLSSGACGTAAPARVRQDELRPLRLRHALTPTDRSDDQTALGVVIIALRSLNRAITCSRPSAPCVRRGRARGRCAGSPRRARGRHGPGPRGRPRHRGTMSRQPGTFRHDGGAGAGGGDQHFARQGFAPEGRHQQRVMLAPDLGDVGRTVPVHAGLPRIGGQLLRRQRARAPGRGGSEDRQGDVRAAAPGDLQRLDATERPLASRRAET